MILHSDSYSVLGFFVLKLRSNVPISEGVSSFLSCFDIDYRMFFKDSPRSYFLTSLFGHIICTIRCHSSIISYFLAALISNPFSSFSLSMNYCSTSNKSFILFISSLPKPLSLVNMFSMSFYICLFCFRI